MSLFSDINTWDVGKTRVENHEPILVFSQRPACLYQRTDMVNVFYCLIMEWYM